MESARFVPGVILPVLAAILLNLALMTRQLVTRGPFSSFDDVWGKIISGYVLLGLPVSLAFVIGTAAVVFIAGRLRAPAWACWLLHPLTYLVAAVTAAALIGLPMGQKWLAVVTVIMTCAGMIHAALAVLGNRLFGKPLQG